MEGKNRPVFMEEKVNVFGVSAESEEDHGEAVMMQDDLPMLEADVTAIEGSEEPKFYEKDLNVSEDGELKDKSNGDPNSGESIARIATMSDDPEEVVAEEMHREEFVSAEMWCRGKDAEIKRKMEENIVVELARYESGPDNLCVADGYALEVTGQVPRRPLDHQISVVVKLDCVMRVDVYTFSWARDSPLIPTLCGVLYQPAEVQQGGNAVKSLVHAGPLFDNRTSNSRKLTCVEIEVVDGRNIPPRGMQFSPLMSKDEGGPKTSLLICKHQPAEGPGQCDKWVCENKKELLSFFYVVEVPRFGIVADARWVPPQLGKRVPMEPSQGREVLLKNYVLQMFGEFAGPEGPLMVSTLEGGFIWIIAWQFCDSYESRRREAYVVNRMRPVRGWLELRIQLCLGPEVSPGVSPAGGVCFQPLRGFVKLKVQSQLQLEISSVFSPDGGSCAQPVRGLSKLKFQPCLGPGIGSVFSPRCGASVQPVRGLLNATVQPYLGLHAGSVFSLDSSASAQPMRGLTCGKNQLCFGLDVGVICRPSCREMRPTVPWRKTAGDRMIAWFKPGTGVLWKRAVSGDWICGQLSGCDALVQKTLCDLRLWDHMQGAIDRQALACSWMEKRRGYSREASIGDVMTEVYAGQRPAKGAFLDIVDAVNGRFASGLVALVSCITLWGPLSYFGCTVLRFLALCWLRCLPAVWCLEALPELGFVRPVEPIVLLGCSLPWWASRASPGSLDIRCAVVSADEARRARPAVVLSTGVLSRG
ncbi:hypothetical protein L7F22_028103 [Adiantum nelumboides]|nr:hypothetical protein [Adiantum nelumboides]